MDNHAGGIRMMRGAVVSGDLDVRREGAAFSGQLLDQLPLAYDSYHGGGGIFGVWEGR